MHSELLLDIFKKREAIILRTRKNIAVMCVLALVCAFALPGYQVEAAETHVDQIEKMDSTYEGFIANDDTLSFEEIKSLESATVVSEYDSLMRLKVAPVSELFHMGMSQENVNRIKTLSVKELVLENAATYPEGVLESKGLSAKTIEAIKVGEYDSVSEAEARRASASLALGIASITRVGNQLNYTIYWHWDNSRPLNLIDDIIVTSISNNYSVMSGATGKVYYAPLNSFQHDVEIRIFPSNLESDNATRFNIDMQYPPPVGSRWAAGGKAFVPTAYGYAGPVDIFAEYFHKWTTVSITVANGTISFPVGTGDLTTTQTTVD